MVSFQEAGEMLDAACEALPREIFRELNGGVNLLPELRRDEAGGTILGLYHNDAMGRYVEIFYGSIAALYGDIPPERFRERLVKTLHHELTHHLEGLAGDRTLERWDEAQKALWGLPPLETNSVLFVDEDDAALAPAAVALFSLCCKAAGLELKCGSAGMTQGAALHPEAVRAAKNLGADISGHSPRQVTAAELDAYDAVLCMTLLEADELAERFPGAEERIECLGETDILPPKRKAGWAAAMKRLNREVQLLVEELMGEDGET